MRAWQRLPLGSASRPPQPPFPRGLPFPNGVSITFWPAGGWLVAFLQSRPLPSWLPSCSYPGLRPQGSAEGPAGWMLGDFYWPLHRDAAFRSPFMGAGLPDRPGAATSRAIWFLCWACAVSSVFGLAEPSWLVSVLTSCWALATCRWMRWWGSHSPTAAGTQSVVSAGGRWSGKSSGPSSAQGKCSGV